LIIVSVIGVPNTLVNGPTILVQVIVEDVYSHDFGDTVHLGGPKNQSFWNNSGNVQEILGAIGPVGPKWGLGRL